ncbi:STAS domain-containing protein [Embleya sp. NPDC056575]|uniref:STAS domain-containing protein n=1 Tax=unclassified Embleya TaxID=2699296 RepID=UPI0036BC1E1B
MSSRRPRNRRPAPAATARRPGRRHRETATHLRVRVMPYGDRLLLRVSGEIDIDTAPLLRSALDTALDHGACRVDVDMRGVTFCDSTALHVLSHARTKATAGRVELALAPGDRLRRILAITNMAHLFAPLAMPVRP